MDTLIQSQKTTISTEAATEKMEARIDAYFEELEASRYGFAPMILVIMACLGGIAAAFAAGESDLKLLAVAGSTAMVEILVIAVAPMRMICWAALVALLVNIAVFIF